MVKPITKVEVVEFDGYLAVETTIIAIDHVQVIASNGYTLTGWHDDGASFFNHHCNDNAFAAPIGSKSVPGKFPTTINMVVIDERGAYSLSNELASRQVIYHDDLSMLFSTKTIRDETFAVYSPCLSSAIQLYWSMSGSVYDIGVRIDRVFTIEDVTVNSDRVIIDLSSKWGKHSKHTPLGGHSIVFNDKDDAVKFLNMFGATAYIAKLVNTNKEGN